MIQINVTEASAPKNVATLDRPDLNLAGNTYSKEQIRTEISKVFATAIRGEATPTSSPSPWSSGSPDLFEKWEVHTAGNYSNFKNASNTPIAVTLEDLTGNFVYIEVTNGVSKKVIAKFQTISGSTNIPDWLATNWTAGSMVLHNKKIFKNTESTLASDIPGQSPKWIEKISNELSQILNPTDIENAPSQKAVADRYDNLLLVSKSFLKDSVLQEDVISMPQTNATDGKFLLPSLNPANAIVGEWGYIETAQLAGYDTITIKGDMASLGNCTYLTVKKTNGTFQNLINNSALNSVTVPIDHTAQIYLYSRFKNATFFFKNKTVSQGLEEDAIRNYIDEKTSGISVDGVGVFKPENYGAVALDPRNPDSGKDCTDAFNDMFADMFANYPTINSYRVVMAGVYRIGGAPVYDKGQINIPFTTNVDWNFKSVYFEGLTRPSLTDRGNNNTLNPLLGSGFYSSYIYTGSDYRHIIRIGEGSNFGLRVGHVFMNNIACYIKTHGTNNESIANNMSGFDFSNLSTFAFTDIYAITTTAGLNTLEPAMNSIGLVMPRANNMASVYGNSLKIMGFGVGAFLTEHLNLNHLIAVFNKDGVQVQNTYPVNVGNATLEHNLCHVRMYPNSAINFGVFQTEDINDTQYWFNRTDKMIKGVASSRVTIGQTMSHVWGGGAIPLTYDSVIKLRYLMNEFGNSKLD